ncbi:hypothetical protein EB232_25300 [Mesorhizobium sp. NZP2077]|nr:hypothetical protein EB232_25300 [Mesorhizobium sp. NZP2077]
MRLEFILDCGREPAKAHHGHGVWKEYCFMRDAEMIEEALRIDDRVRDGMGGLFSIDSSRGFSSCRRCCSQDLSALPVAVRGSD